MEKVINYFVVMALMLCAPGISLGAEDDLEIISAGSKKVFTLAKLKKRLPILKLKIDDRVYKKQMTFDGFLLSDVLKLGGAAPAGTDEIVFEAKDGYAPSLSLAQLGTNKGYVVFAEHGKGSLGKVKKAQSMVPAAPYYLTWEGGKDAIAELPAPYQLFRIEYVNFAQKYGKAFPSEAKADSAELAGFKVFKSKCMKCHSMNGQGGDVGPDLNSPMNVTQYWNPSVLKKFIRTPESVRIKTKMPAFEKMTDEVLNQLITYISFMESHKE